MFHLLEVAHCQLRAMNPQSQIVAQTLLPSTMSCNILGSAGLSSKFFAAKQPFKSDLCESTQAQLSLKFGSTVAGNTFSNLIIISIPLQFSLKSVIKPVFSKAFQAFSKNPINNEQVVYNILPSFLISQLICLVKSEYNSGQCISAAENVKKNCRIPLLSVIAFKSSLTLCLYAALPVILLTQRESLDMKSMKYYLMSYHVVLKWLNEIHQGFV